MTGDRARARRLAAQLRDLRAAGCTLPDALALLDADDRLLWCNPASERLLGLRWPQDRHRNIKESFQDQALGAWLSTEPPGTDDVVSPVNAEIRLQLSLLPYADRHRLLLARDVSRVLRLEQVRRDFVANVSHELRTPLTVIHGYLEMLEPDDVPALAPVLHEMRAQSERMRQIVEDLLTLSHLEAQHTLPKKRVAMRPLLDALHGEAQALSQGRHPIAVDDAAAWDLVGAPKELHSAFSNLISNAVRYTPDAGTIRIAWRNTAAGAEFAVTDTGPGIPAQHLRRLTERFYRVSTSRSRASGGTGLGLSIVKHVLELHGARLRMESTLGEGSVFACVFGRERLVARR